MAILDTILQQLNIWDGQLLLFIQNHLRSETLNPIVIAVTNLGNAGIFWNHAVYGGHDGGRSQRGSGAGPRYGGRNCGAVG